MEIFGGSVERKDVIVAAATVVVAASYEGVVFTPQVEKKGEPASTVLGRRDICHDDRGQGWRTREVEARKQEELTRTKVFIRRRRCWPETVAEARCHKQRNLCHAVSTWINPASKYKELSRKTLAFVSQQSERR